MGRVSVDAFLLPPLALSDATDEVSVDVSADVSEAVDVSEVAAVVVSDFAASAFGVSDFAVSAFFALAVVLVLGALAIVDYLPINKYRFGCRNHQAVFATSRFNSSIICSRMMNFCTLPVTVMGYSVTNLI